ncbi:Site-specific recombinase XerD [Filomicrobium insigne]|uniref:Site-specific recombinase XerD n=1 Tax=Filomicrobium insigne TaxID=418854 RepID=A0A1H0SC35_9HYPH|nr:tyrosine-type recombinase/integrase [Filomicrobium insigne]SDP39280.1 Site-specific recombinase XerD [Filomicrobium insigne]
MVTLKLKYVHEDVDRHGNVRIYFRRRKGAPKIRIQECPGTEAFSKRYHELLAASEAPPVPPTSLNRTPTPGTYRWLCVSYFGSPAFRLLDPSTQRTRRRVLESTFQEPVFPGAKEAFADFPLARITTRVLKVLRDRKADLPGAASDRVKAIRAAFKWALEDELIANNPARDLAKLPLSGTGWHTWTLEEVAQFEKRHPIGTKARLALALFMWTGVRRSDVVLLGKQHARDGWHRFTQYKNRNRKPIIHETPILDVLQEVIDASPTGDLTYLVTAYDRPFTAAGFGNWFRERCNEAGLTGCSAHGLRKAAAASAAENGATSSQLMAIFGWMTLAEAERYTKAARRKKMAGEAMGKLIRTK